MDYNTFANSYLIASFSFSTCLITHKRDAVSAQAKPETSAHGCHSSYAYYIYISGSSLSIPIMNEVRTLRSYL